MAYLNALQEIGEHSPLSSTKNGEVKYRYAKGSVLREKEPSTKGDGMRKVVGKEDNHRRKEKSQNARGL